MKGNLVDTKSINSKNKSKIKIINKYNKSID